MFSSVTCETPGCNANGETFLFPNQTDPVMCGECKQFMNPVLTDIPVPPLKDMRNGN